ncbi:MAG: DUF4367 domain-containing protein [Oscillospiraceae bacterium]|jgi:hypothetical protein|nr:DUF4367 domain-containing protein [Oscillospiraceae bacterium]
MKENIHGNTLSEVVFRQAVIDSYERELTELAAEPDIELSARQQGRMAALLKKSYRLRRSTFMLLQVKRAAVAAAALFIALTCITLVNPTVRASVGEAIGSVITWFSDSTSFGPNDTDGEAVDLDWYPTHLPVGFSEETRIQPGDITMVIYTDDDGRAIEFKYLTGNNTTSVNNENVEYSQKFYDDIVYHTFTATDDNHSSAVIWDMDGYLFDVSGYLPIEQLIEIARSVVKLQ